MRSKLPALEKNILKYRALQMVLLLHEVESFREFTVQSIRSTESLRSLRGANEYPEGTKINLKKALSVLVSKEVLTQDESDEVQKIIDVRNTIGHDIHQLVEDISAPREIRSGKSIYDYAALQRFEHYRKKVSDGMRKHFVLSVSFREVAFEQAEAAYKEELERLHKRIERQLAARRAAA